MQPAELEKLLGKKSQPLIVDVRTPLEFRAGHIPGARNIPFEKVWGKRQALKREGRALLLCCEHGPRAWLAGGLLKLAGLKVDHLSGHMMKWKQQGRSLQKK